MITITAPRGLESGLQALVHTEMQQCIEALAEKYDFPVEQEITKLPKIKFVKKRGPIPKLGKQTKAKPVVTSNTAKKVVSGYLSFSAKIRTSVRSELKSELVGDKKLVPQLIISEIAKRWGLLSEDERQLWDGCARGENPMPDIYTLSNPPPVLKAVRQPCHDSRFDELDDLPEPDMSVPDVPEEKADDEEYNKLLDDQVLELDDLSEASTRLGDLDDLVLDDEEDAPKDDADDDDEESVPVTEFVYDGKKYLKDDSGTVYDRSSFETVGELVDGVLVLA
jgi:hypothetical protein